MNLLEESFARLEEVKLRVRQGNATADVVDELVDEAMKRITAEVDALAFEARELTIELGRDVWANRRIDL